MSNTKKRIQSSIERYSAKQLKQNKPSRKNKKPEQEVVKALLSWLQMNGFHAFRVESQAAYNPNSGHYTSSFAPTGCSDILGTTPCGRSLYLEVKAPGKRSTLKNHQRDFLLEGIRRGSLACCSDSVQHFQNLYDSWLLTDERSDLLTKDLPLSKKIKTESHLL